VDGVPVDVPEAPTVRYPKYPKRINNGAPLVVKQTTVIPTAVPFILLILKFRVVLLKLLKIQMELCDQCYSRKNRT